MKKSLHLPYDVVLLPPQNIAVKAIDMSIQISSQFPVEFVVDGKSRFPHVTLYQLEIPNRNLASLIRNFEDISVKGKVIETYLTGYSNHSTFIFWDVENSSKLQKLHETIILKLNNLRDGLPVSILSKNILSKENHLEIKKYGAIGLFKNYHPHITLTRVKPSIEPQKVLNTLSDKRIPVTFKRIGLARLAQYGTVVEILKVFDLL